MSDTVFHMINGAPQPVAPFSHATESGGWVFLTGQMPTDPDDPNKPLPEGVERQTTRVMDNLKIVLEGMNLSLSDVVQMRVFLTEFERDYAAMNAVYQSYFEPGRLPARTCVGVTALAVEALVEIDCVARRPEGTT
ncbi:MAG: RidA family protein [Pseudomonadota bacterium]